MIKRIFTCFLLFMAIAGCSKCVLLRSEYYDITGSVVAPKPEDAVIDIYMHGQEVGRPYAEIGAVKVMAQHGISKTALNKELKRRGSAAGADAVVDVLYIEDKGNDLALCGKLFATKRNMTATGKAVVFIQPAPQEDKK
ncbi:MAG TPA: hypothetical protein DCL35_04435 [Candidatus Omnitrophica bacterium]|nr:hypothetical protein [Candidatus Omnitrophota bacterium]